MKIAQGLETLELPLEFFVNRNQIHPTLVWDANTVMLVDAGFPGQFEELRAAMEKAGVAFNRLKLVVMTHHDIGHIGNLAALRQAGGGNIRVLAHEAEKPYIQGERPPLKFTPERMAQINARLDALPEAERQAIKAKFENLGTPVDSLVSDGQELPCCGGIFIIHTPGHTPGHICLYLQKYRTLVAGDALNVVEGQLQGPNVQNSHDLKAALASLEKFTRYDIETVICYHGGVFSHGVNARLAALARGQA